MLWAIEFPSSQSVDEREHSVGEACRSSWIVLRDVLHARLKVRAGLRCVDDSQRFNALPIARRTFCVDSPSPRSIA